MENISEENLTSDHKIMSSSHKEIVQDRTWNVQPSLTMSVVNSTLFSTCVGNVPICKLGKGSTVQGIAIRICKENSNSTRPNKFIFIDDAPKNRESSDNNQVIRVYHKNRGNYNHQIQSTKFTTNSSEDLIPPLIGYGIKMVASGSSMKPPPYSIFLNSQYALRHEAVRTISTSIPDDTNSIDFVGHAGKKSKTHDTKWVNNITESVWISHSAEGASLDRIDVWFKVPKIIDMADRDPQSRTGDDVVVCVIMNKRFLVPIYKYVIDKMSDAFKATYKSSRLGNRSSFFVSSGCSHDISGSGTITNHEIGRKGIKSGDPMDLKDWKNTLSKNSSTPSLTGGKRKEKKDDNSYISLDSMLSEICLGEELSKEDIERINNGRQPRKYEDPH